MVNRPQLEASRRGFLRALGSSLAWPFWGSALGGENNDQVVVGRGRLEVATARFDCTPPLGVPSPTLGLNPVVRQIQGPMETRLFALRQGSLTIGWANSDYNIAGPGRGLLSEALHLPLEQTVVSETHNHSIVTAGGLSRNVRGFGSRFFRDFRQAARALQSHFEPATLSWAVEEQRFITYNRKGRRRDGSTYFMREEDRIKLGDFEGAIDPLATLLRFDRTNGDPLLLVGHFTGHPVVSYNLEEPVINPDYSGWSIMDLVESFYPCRPVGVFLQGCAGDISAKGMFDGPVRARAAGARLGDSFIRASAKATAVRTDALGLARGTAQVPFGPLPSVRELKHQREELLDFQKRAEAGDEDTLQVLGYNFSAYMEMKYRRNLARPLLRWTDWALEVHEKGSALPDSLPLPLQVVALGEAAIVTIPCEAFSSIGIRIREQSPFQVTIPTQQATGKKPRGRKPKPAAYSNGSLGYIGASEDVGDREYMSAFYRYTRRPPFARPAGDAIVHKAVELLENARDAMKESV